MLTVTTDKACTIYGNGFTAQDNTTSAEFQIFKNGVYKFFAVDPNTDATSELSITITSFGDSLYLPITYSSTEVNFSTDLIKLA